MPLPTGSSLAGIRPASSRNTAALGAALAWPIGVIAAVLYGSLIPFAIDWSAVAPSKLFHLSSTSLTIASLEDFVTNVAVYVPLGLAIMLSAHRLGLSRMTQALAAMSLGAVVSVTAETLQTGIAVRVASVTDVALNVAGALMGAVLGLIIQGFLPGGMVRLRRRIVNRPFGSAAAVLAIGLLVYGVTPFDFVTSTERLHASFMRSRIDLTSLHFASLAVGIGRLVGAAWFAALGYLAMLAYRESGRSDVAAVFTAARDGIVIAGVIEIMQLFTNSHVCDFGVFALRTLALLCGVWCGAVAAGRHTAARLKERPGLALPTSALVALGLAQLVAILLTTVNVDVLSAHFVPSGGVHWLPFETLWRGSMTGAVSDGTAMAATFAALAITLALVTRRAYGAASWPLVTVAVILSAVTVEALRLFSPSQAADLTRPALALVAVLATSRLAAALQWDRLRRQPVTAAAARTAEPRDYP